MAAHMRKELHSEERYMSRAEKMVRMVSLIPIPGANSDTEDSNDDDDDDYGCAVNEDDNNGSPHKQIFVFDTDIYAPLNTSQDKNKEAQYEAPEAQIEEIQSDDEENAVVVPQQREEVLAMVANTRSLPTALGLPMARSLPKNAARKADYRIDFSWKEDEFAYKADSKEDNFTVPENIKGPFDYFKTFFSDNIVSHIVEQTNLYSLQETNESINTNFNEIRDFLGIELMMGIIQLPAYRDYWSTDTRIEQVANIMPVNRYEKLRQYLHFTNNEDMDNDSYFKIRPILNMVRANCLNIEQESKCSVDEMMIPYKGTRAGSKRQYMKGKPKKWGFKMFVRSGVSGIVYDFLLYAGLETFRDISFTNIEERTGFGAKVVLALCKSLADAPVSVLYFDNYFSSLELISLLRNEYGILALGTLRSNRLRGCVMKDDKELKKEGRGSFQQLVDNENRLALVKWFDNKSVILGSNYVDAYPVSTTKRFDKETKDKKEIQCPQIVKHYNAHMGGVDLSDMLVALYSTSFRTRRWYMSIFSQLLDICVNNAWLLYRRDLQLFDEKNKSTSKHLPLKKFRLSVCQGLISKARKRGRPCIDQNISPPRKIQRPVLPRPTEEVRHDQVGHFPFHSLKGRCRHCKKGQTTTACSKCNLRLCYTEKRNCFLDFHVRK